MGHFLFLEFTSNFLVKLQANVSGLMTSQYPLYWLEYGTLLGSWREEDIIRWDDDGDLGIFDFILAQFPMRYESADWIFRRNPYQNSSVYDGSNTVSARIISKWNGVFVDLFAYLIIGNYLYNSWSINDFNFWQKIDDLLPIGEGVFLKNKTFLIPRNTERWLLNEYKTLEAPPDKLWKYDENYTFNDEYWYNQFDLFSEQYPSYPI